MGERPRRPGGVIHGYQRYDPTRFPPPTAPPADVVTGAFDHMLAYGSMDHLSEEELARAVRIDPAQIQGLGPSLDALIAMLEARKRKILETWETERVRRDAGTAVDDAASGLDVPTFIERVFRRELAARHLAGLERLWYHVEDRAPDFAKDLLRLNERIGEQFEVEALASSYDFTGRTPMTIADALRLKEELEAIDALLEQLREARENATIAVIDMEQLAEFAAPEDLEGLRALQQQVQDYLREMAERQGLEFTRDGYRLTPKAMRLYQSSLLSTIFEDLHAARRGRHVGPIEGEGAVELPSTRPFAFGDSVVHMDVTQSVINAIVREGGAGAGRLRVRADDVEIHRTRNTPKCATAVVMDMSGSMRYGGLYVACKRMAIGLDWLIRSEYPGDVVRFVEMYSFAKPRTVADLPALMPKPVTIHEPWVRLTADLADERITELDVPPHFTNIQHALAVSRRLLAAQDTPNRQIILITDGLPTAHFEGEKLFLLYPPDPRTEEATMREARRCARDGITINIFLLPSWSQSREDVQFAQRMVEATKGRVFFTGGHDLDRFVLWDYVKRRRRIIG